MKDLQISLNRLPLHASDTWRDSKMYIQFNYNGSCCSRILPEGLYMNPLFFSTYEVNSLCLNLTGLQQRCGLQQETEHVSEKEYMWCISRMALVVRYPTCTISATRVQSTHQSHALSHPYWPRQQLKRPVGLKISLAKGCLKKTG